MMLPGRYSGQISIDSGETSETGSDIIARIVRLAFKTGSQGTGRHNAFEGLLKTEFLTYVNAGLPKKASQSHKTPWTLKSAKTNREVILPFASNHRM